MGPDYVEELKRQLNHEMQNDNEVMQQIAGRSSRRNNGEDQSEITSKVIDMLMDKVIQPTMKRIGKDKVENHNRTCDDIMDLHRTGRSPDLK